MVAQLGGGVFGQDVSQPLPNYRPGPQMFLTLPYCLASFVQCYPRYQTLLERVLLFYLNGGPLFNRQLTSDMLGFGDWLLAEIKTTGYAEYLLA